MKNLILTLAFVLICGLAQAQCVTYNVNGTVTIKKSCIQYMDTVKAKTGEYLLIKGKAEGPVSDWPGWTKINLVERIKNLNQAILLTATDDCVTVGAPKLGYTMSKSWLGQWYFKASLGMMAPLTAEQLFNIKALLNP